jgi:hypothetical protein
MIVIFIVIRSPFPVHRDLVEILSKKANPYSLIQFELYYIIYFNLFSPFLIDDKGCQHLPA